MANIEKLHMQSQCTLHPLPHQRDRVLLFRGHPGPLAPHRRTPCIRTSPFLSKDRVSTHQEGVSSSRSAVIAGCAVAAPERRQASPVEDYHQKSDLGWRTDFAEHYSLLEIIGKGNFGTVWLAANRQDPSQHVAVKVLPKTQPDRSREEVLHCIRREVALWGRLSGDSRHVVQLLGLYEDASAAYLVQQLCAGGDLGEALRDGPLPESCCAAVMWCVLSAIRDCHQHGLAMMDVKPANFLLTAPLRDTHTAPGTRPSASCHRAPGSGGDSGAGQQGGAVGSRSSGGTGGTGRLDLSSLRLADEVAAGSGGSGRAPSVVACDFGCSLSIGEIARGAKRGGSPVFFAPEQFTSRHGLEVDVWAAGVLVYLLLTGRYPFWDCKRSELDPKLPAYQVMLAVCGSPISLSGPLWRGVSREARDLLAQLLDRNPATRISAAEALAHPWFARWMKAPGGAAVTAAASPAAGGGVAARGNGAVGGGAAGELPTRGYGGAQAAAAVRGPSSARCAEPTSTTAGTQSTLSCSAGNNVVPVQAGFGETGAPAPSHASNAAGPEIGSSRRQTGNARPQSVETWDDEPDEPITFCYAD